MQNAMSLRLGLSWEALSSQTFILSAAVLASEDQGPTVIALVGRCHAAGGPPLPPPH